MPLVRPAAVPQGIWEALDNDSQEEYIAWFTFLEKNPTTALDFNQYALRRRRVMAGVNQARRIQAAIENTLTSVSRGTKAGPRASSRHKIGI